MGTKREKKDGGEVERGLGLVDIATPSRDCSALVFLGDRASVGFVSPEKAKRKTKPWSLKRAKEMQVRKEEAGGVIGIGGREEGEGFGGWNSGIWVKLAASWNVYYNKCTCMRS